MRPVERECGHLEQSDEMSGRRRVNDDPAEHRLGQSVTKPDERVKLIDAGWCEREQLARDGAIVGCVQPRTQQSIESSVHPSLVFGPPSREGGISVDLSRVQS